MHNETRAYVTLLRPNISNIYECNHKQAISARERALYQLTVCFEFQSRSERSFLVTIDLLNRENLKVAFAQLCNELKG